MPVPCRSRGRKCRGSCRRSGKQQLAIISKWFTKFPCHSVGITGRLTHAKHWICLNKKKREENKSSLRPGLLRKPSWTVNPSTPKNKEKQNLTNSCPGLPGLPGLKRDKSRGFLGPPLVCHVGIGRKMTSVKVRMARVNPC